MNCRTFWSRRTRHAHEDRQFWPDDLREHLATCPDCTAADEYLSRPSAVDVDLSAVEARIGAAIASDLHPVRPLPSSGWRTATLVLVSAVIVAVASALLGTRGWQRMSTPELTITVATLTVALCVAAREVSSQMVPGGKQNFRPTLLFGFCLTTMPALALWLFPWEVDTRFAGAAFRCWAVGTAAALALSPFLWLVLRRGFPLALPLHLASVGLLAGLAGLALLEVHCPILTGSHKAVGHGAVTITGALAGLLGSWCIQRVASRVR